MRDNYKGTPIKVRYLPTTGFVLKMECYIDGPESFLLAYRWRNDSELIRTRTDYNEYIKVHDSSDYYMTIYSYSNSFSMGITLVVILFVLGAIVIQKI
jgi:hypothetical protein